MKSRGPEGSLTILPVRVGDRRLDGASGVVGVMLERQGLRHIELGERSFTPSPDLTLDQLAQATGAFVDTGSITTGYALYAEFNGNRRVGLVEMRAVVVDSTGAIVWTDRQGAEDEAIQRLESKEPMTFCMVLAQQLAPALGLDETTARAAKPGKMAELMEAHSALPPKSERAAMPPRQEQLKESGPSAKLTVCGVRVAGALDSAATMELAESIGRAGLCKSRATAQAPALEAFHAGPDESRALWDMARAFRSYCREHPSRASYALYADYGFDPQNWQHGFVHFVVCDRSGEWVIVDMQNNNHPDYQAVKPTSAADCSAVLLRRLRGYLR